MRWKRLGRIFDPQEHQLPLGCRLFAQSPQALVLADRIRIYFSTRRADGDSGMYLSHVCFVDFDRSLSKLLAVAQHEVLPLGELGSFDEHGIFPINVTRVDDRLLGYTTGWSRRHSVSVETAVGLVTSADDGASFQRAGPGPVLSASLHEPFLVGDAFVKQIGEICHMWYMYGTQWFRSDPSAAPDRVYKIGHATSPNGVEWTKSAGGQIIADTLGSMESQALPCVAQLGRTYHMFFCYRHSSDFRTNPARGYRIGQATSDDLVHWTRNDDGIALDIPANGWDSDMQCYPHVFQCDGRTYLLYNGNAFGRDGFGAAVLED